MQLNHPNSLETPSRTHATPSAPRPNRSRFGTQVLGGTLFGLLSLSTTSTLFASPTFDYSGRTVSVGNSMNLGSMVESSPVMDPPASEHSPVVGIGIAGNDNTYVWYADGTVSRGTSLYWEDHISKTAFTLPAGKNPWDIVSMAIRGTDNHVFTYYEDGTYSEGWSQDLDAHEGPLEYTLAPDRVPTDIVGIASNGSNGRFYAWYSDGTVSAGTPDDLDAHQGPYGYILPPGKKIGHILDIAITGSNDSVFAWYQDLEDGSGHVNIRNHVDTRAMDILRRYRLAGLSVAVSKNGRMVLEKGYGYRKLDAGDRMTPTSRGLLGSVSKVITSLSAMRLAETTGFSVDDPVYGPGGALQGIPYTESQAAGIARHNPIVAKAIASDNKVYTWDQNGNVCVGTSADPDAHGGPLPYSLAPGMNPEDVRAIAITPLDQVCVWYDDATYSVGNSVDLDSILPRNPSSTVSLPPDYGMDNITGMAIANNGVVYTWFDDGMMSAGSGTDLDSAIPLRTYSVKGSNSAQIRAMGIAKSNNRVFAWTTGGNVLLGTSQKVGSYGAPYAYQVLNSSYNQSRDWEEWYADMKIDHLMSHTSGFKGGGDVDAAANMFHVPEDSLTYTDAHRYVLRTRKLLFAPGTGASYSNHGAGLLGHIISELSGMPYRNYARGQIIDPLGLQIRAASSGQSAADMWRHDYVDGIPEAYLDDHTNDLGLAAGGWKSSAGDMVRLMLATDGNPNHADILSQQSLSLMHAKPYPAVSSFAHGWDMASGQWLGHGGRLGGGTSYIAKFPAGTLGEGSEPVSVAVIANSKIGDDRGGSNTLRKLAIDIAKAAQRANTGNWYDLH